MSDLAIRVERLGKKYRIRHQQVERYTALRDVIADKARRMFRGSKVRLGEVPAIEDFWALRDVSFEVKRGEVMGIIGRNGAGKSTLLKILSRITEPTEGRVELDGRIASLLEVGTGFHPELTGRENIYLNGAILGLARAEIRKKFDEIVAFAEVEKFLDTPVKRYSSGMYVRLAFAVGAHLESEILIVDEVLAVGDASFQKKCLDWMREVRESGRTVLFVSHNLGSLLSVCTAGILLDKGAAVGGGDIHSVVKSYQIENSRGSNLHRRVFDGPLQTVAFSGIFLNEQDLQTNPIVLPTEELRFSVRGQALERIEQFRSALSLSKDAVRLFTVQDERGTLERGNFESTYAIPAYLLRPGRYTVSVGGRRLSDNAWTWGVDLASFDLFEQWVDGCDRDETGLINLQVRGRRERIAERSG